MDMFNYKVSVSASLQQAGLARTGGGVADYRFVVSDVPLRFQTIGERFLGRSLGAVEKVDW